MNSTLSIFEKVQNKTNLKLVYIAGLLFFFFMLFDGAVSFVVPIAVTQIGLSKSAMGLIYGSSSVFGAIFDFILSKTLTNTHFRRIYMLMFILCLLCLFVLANANTVLLFLIAMALWGFYFDLSNFANFDFISRRTLKRDHSQGFGIIWMFRALGYTIAPLVIGSIIGNLIDSKVFIYMGIFLSISFGFFILLVFVTNKNKREMVVNKDSKLQSTSFEINLWKKVGKKMFPVLIMTTILWIIEASFWTIGPFMYESIPELGSFKGLFLALYTLPPLFIGWFLSPLSKKLGKKKTAFYALITGSIFLVSILFVNSGWIILSLVFIASCFIALCLPSIAGVYSDYIVEAPHLEKEIEALEDFFTNIGYVIGPILAGFLAEKFGNIKVFSILGLVSIIATLILVKVTPKNIQIDKK